MKKNKRKVFHVVPSGDRWQVVYERFDDCEDKKEALEIAKFMAKEIHAMGGLSQIKVHGKDGKIQTEYTYGKDPKRHKG